MVNAKKPAAVVDVTNSVATQAAKKTRSSIQFKFCSQGQTK